jgi:hypothetical protein
VAAGTAAQWHLRRHGCVSSPATSRLTPPWRRGVKDPESFPTCSALRMLGGQPSA